MGTRDLKTSLAGPPKLARLTTPDLTFSDVLRESQASMAMLARRGIEVPQADRQIILQAAAADPKTLDPVTQDKVYAACTQVAEQATESCRRSQGARPFSNALFDAEQLVRYAAEAGRPIDAAVTADIFGARAAFNEGRLSDNIRARFYEAYASIAKGFGDVTAETIHSAKSPEVRKNLWLFTVAVIVLTILVALVSVVSFFFDDLSERIKTAVVEADPLAVQLRTNMDLKLKNVEARYVTDPCSQLKIPDEATTAQVGTDELQKLQQFATLIRDVQSNAIKLNAWLSKPFKTELECDPYGAKCNNVEQYSQDATAHLQINPAVVNYPSEVFCKIYAYQRVRAFGINIKNDYAVIYGAIAAYALPICYALLGAMAFQLRYFAELIRRKTYHFSFAEPARLVTAVIAGAICGLFNPARGLNLPPLGIAFLVGYGVEVFFRFLDTLTNAFVPNFQASPSQAVPTTTITKPPPVTATAPPPAAPAGAPHPVALSA